MQLLRVWAPVKDKACNRHGRMEEEKMTEKTRWSRKLTRKC